MIYFIILFTSTLLFLGFSQYNQTKNQTRFQTKKVRSSETFNPTKFPNKS